MYALIIILLLIIVIASFIHRSSIAEYFNCDYPCTVSTRNTKNMSYDLRGDIPPEYTFTGPWLQSDIYNPDYTRYSPGKWLQSDIYNFDRGYNYVRPNGTPLYL